MKRALSDFLENHMFDGLAVPGRKFFADAFYGLLKSGSPLVSEQTKALCKESRLKVTENRLLLNYSSLGLSPLASNVAEFSVRGSWTSHINWT